MTDHRDGRVVCPECGASCFVTDDRCVECGFDFLSARPVPLRDEDAAAQRYLDYGRAALAAGRSRQALSYFDRACALAPRRAGAHLARAQALRALGDVEGAFGECGVALCLTCVGALIGVPLILAAAGLFMAGVGIATGSPIAGLAVFGGMAGTGGLAGWLSRRARPRHPRP